MMFRAKKEPRALWPVVIEAPREDGSGALDRFDTKVMFRLLFATEFDQLTKGGGADMAALLRTHVVGWEGIADDEGTPLSFTPENLEHLLNIAFVRRAFGLALVECSQGAAAKNSKTGSPG